MTHSFYLYFISSQAHFGRFVFVFAPCTQAIFIAICDDGKVNCQAVDFLLSPFNT